MSVLASYHARAWRHLAASALEAAIHSHKSAAQSECVLYLPVRKAQVPRVEAKELLDFFAQDAQIRNPGPALFPAQQGPLLKYPPWLRGEWQVSDVRLEGVAFSLGQRFVNRLTPGTTKASVIAALADVGASMERAVSYTERYVASADGKSAAPDRPYNIQHQVDAFLGVPRSVQGVRTFADSARLDISFTTPRRDKAVQATDERRAELFVTAHSSAAPAPDRFVADENFRQVTRASKAVQVGDYQVVRDFCRQADGSVAVKQRVAAFLQPQDALYFDAGGRAVAVYDHTYLMQPLAQGASANL